MESGKPGASPSMVLHEARLGFSGNGLAGHHALSDTGAVWKSIWKEFDSESPIVLLIVIILFQLSLLLYFSNKELVEGILAP